MAGLGISFHETPPFTTALYYELWLKEGAKGEKHEDYYLRLYYNDHALNPGSVCDNVYMDQKRMG